MPSISVAAEADIDKLKEYIENNSDSTLAHDFRWQQIIKNTFGHQDYYLIASDQGRINGVLPLFLVKSKIFGSGLISMPYLNAGGVLADNEDISHALLAAALKKQTQGQFEYLELRLVKSNPLLINDFTQVDRKVTFLLRLEQEPEKLLEKFSAKLRSQIRRPGKEGAVARVVSGKLCSKNDIQNFYNVFSRQMRELGTPVYPLRLFEETFEAFKTDAGLALVELNGQVTSAGIFIKHKSRVELLWAASLRQDNKYSVNMLLYWEIMQYLCREGIEIFDFGRTSPKSGGYQFKKQWGAEELPLPWYYSKQSKKIPNIDPKSKNFSFPVFLWQHLPYTLTNFLGPKITKHIP